MKSLVNYYCYTNIDFVDVFNIKYLLGEFSKNYKLQSFNIWYFILVLILTNYLQLLTYIFINEKNLTLFIINTVALVYLLIKYLTMENILLIIQVYSKKYLTAEKFNLEKKDFIFNCK